MESCMTASGSHIHRSDLQQKALDLFLNYSYIKLRRVLIFHGLRVKCQDIFVVSSN